jgi:hypothetical protein
VVGLLFGGDRLQSAVGVGTVAGVVVVRTLLQDRIANLNGRSVDLVLRQDLRGFVRWAVGTRTGAVRLCIAIECWSGCVAVGQPDGGC